MELIMLIPKYRKLFKNIFEYLKNKTIKKRKFLQINLKYIFHIKIDLSTKYQPTVYTYCL